MSITADILIQRIERHLEDYFSIPEKIKGKNFILGNKTTGIYGDRCREHELGSAAQCKYCLGTDYALWLPKFEKVVKQGFYLSATQEFFIGSMLEWDRKDFVVSNEISYQRNTNSPEMFNNRMSLYSWYKEEKKLEEFCSLILIALVNTKKVRMDLKL